MKSLAFSLWLVLALGTPAFAKNGNSAFDQGKRSFEGGNYARALDLFSAAIEGAGDATTRNKAYYFQGLTLYEMGYYYSALTSFRNVLLSADDRNKEVYEKAIKNSVSIADKLNMVERIGKAIDKLPPAFIPSSVNGLAHYAMGVADFEAGNIEGAMSHLKSVSPESSVYTKAMLYLGVLSTKRRDYKEATFYFDKVLSLTQGKADLFPMQELARLNLARTVYSAGDIERSIELYAQFVSSSSHWLTVLLEASWPLMRVSDTTVSLGNLQTVLSPFYREELVGEAYVLRSTILFSLCKYEEMRQTLSQFFTLYDPILRAMQNETGSVGSAEAFYRAFVSKKGLNRAFLNFAYRDEGIKRDMKVLQLLRDERRNVAKFGRNEQMRRMAKLLDDAENDLQNDIGAVLQRLHKRKLAELVQQREQANYLKVEIVTGEKELIEGQKGLPPKRVVDVETTVAAGYHFWPFEGEYWEDELGAFVYTTESSCVN